MSAEKPMSGAVGATDMELRVMEAMLDTPCLESGAYDWTTMARAAIRAMREPTEEMVDMGGRGIARDTQYFGGAMTLARYSSHQVEAENRLRADAAWAAMIDAATAHIQESATAAVPLVPGRHQGA